jgi:hypothetical protein
VSRIVIGQNLSPIGPGGIAREVAPGHGVTPSIQSGQPIENEGDQAYNLRREAKADAMML